MYDQVITFILAGARGENLRPLTDEQPSANLPFGGVFRVLDFVLSNVLQAQLRHIYILTRYKREPLNAHIQSSWPHLSAGFRWDCGEDLVCLPAADDFRQIPEILRKSAAQTALILSGEQIYRMDYRKILRQHAADTADVTSPMNGVYAFKRDALLRKGDLKFEDYEATAPAFIGYGRTVETLDDYYAANMDFLTDRPGFDPYSDKKLLQESRYATNSRVALAARLNGCKVSSSIISAGVRVESGAVIENSVILPGAHIGSGAEVRNAIVAENSAVPAGAQLQMDGDPDRHGYTLTPNGVVVFAAQREPDSPARPIRRRCARVATKARFAIAR